jgi:hypothetical protein
MTQDRYPTVLSAVDPITAAEPRQQPPGLAKSRLGLPTIASSRINTRRSPRGTTDLAHRRGVGTTFSNIT